MVVAILLNAKRVLKMAKGNRPWEDEAEIGDEPDDYEELEEGSEKWVNLL